MGIEEINRDRDKFLEHVQHSLEPELAKIGLQLINVNITDITDESGYIDAIGQKAASLAIQQARGDVADNEKMGETRVAAAERDKSIQVANARKEQAIGTREARARAGGAASPRWRKSRPSARRPPQFEREAQVKLAEQQMRMQVAEADAAAIDGENQAAARVAASQAELAIKKAEAYETGRKPPQAGRSDGHGSAEPGDGQGRPGRGRDASKPSSGPSWKLPPRPRRPG